MTIKPKNLLTALVSIPGFLFASTTLVAQDFSATLAYDSKYVSQGRDNLGDGGMPSVEVAAEFESGFTGGIWYADADDVNYDETNYFVEYGFVAGSLEMYVGYTHLAFNEGPSDDEVGFGITSTELPIDIAADFVYSEEANGPFVELSVAKPYELNSTFSVSPYFMVALDYGYASEAHDGENSYQFGVDIELILFDSFGLSGHIAHSMEGKDVELDVGGDQTWVSVALNYRF